VMPLDQLINRLMSNIGLAALSHPSLAALV